VRRVEQISLLVDHLGIQVDGKRVALTGTTGQLGYGEKLVLLVGNVQGAGRVDDQLQVVQPVSQALFYTVKRGHALEDRASILWQWPNPLGSSRQTGRSPGAQRDLPGADAVHSPINSG
jgi:hypothetical protein